MGGSDAEDNSEIEDGDNDGDDKYSLGSDDENDSQYSDSEEEGDLEDLRSGIDSLMTREMDIPRVSAIPTVSKLAKEAAKLKQAT